MFAQQTTLRDRLVKSDAFLGYALVLPLVAWLAATVLYPLFYTVELSFHNQKLLGTASQFVGLQTYSQVLSNELFWVALKNSLIWTVGNSLLQGILGLATALLLNKKFRGQKFLRTWVIIPWIIPTVVMAVMWKWILSATYGVLGWILVRVGLFDTAPVFLGDPFNSMPTVIFLNSWRWFPFMAVVILAALQTIPQEYYEAAAVDGASKVQQFFAITMPCIRPTFSTLFLIGTLFSFNLFDVIWLLTEGGPGDTTTTLPLLIYKTAFKLFQMSQSAAISVIVFLLLLTFVVVLLRVDPSLKEFDREGA